MSEDEAVQPVSKNYFNGSNFTSILTVWKDHNSVQIRVAHDLRELPEDADDRQRKSADVFSRYGVYDVFRSDFYALLPIVKELAAQNGARLILEFS